MPYDALKTPNPEDWLDLDEQERIDQAPRACSARPPVEECAKVGLAGGISRNQLAVDDAGADR